MRDLVMLGFLVIYIPLGLTSSFAAYLLWGWAGLIAVGSYLFGFMAGLPYAQIFALLTLICLFLKPDTRMQPFAVNRTMMWMGLFVAHGFIVAILAYPELERNWEMFGNVAKTAIFCLLMPMLVTSRLRIHAMVLMLVMAVSFHGALEGLKFIASGGAHNARGIPKFGDNNQFALVLLMVLPLSIYLVQYSERRIVRWGFGMASLLTVLAVVSTHSRGGLLGLFVIATWIVLKGRRKVSGLLVIAATGALVIALAPQDWSDRMNTIQQAEDDASFMGRVAAWKVSAAIAAEHPVFGGGFRSVQSEIVWEKFKNAPGLLSSFRMPPETRSGLAAHSIWFEVLGDQGFVGLALFLALLINAFVTRHEILKLVRRSPIQFQWARDLSNLLAAVLLVYMVSGSLLSAAYFEFPYIAIMLMEVVKLNLSCKSIRVSQETAP